jgi:hypothetical protein
MPAKMPRQEESGKGHLAAHARVGAFVDFGNIKF